MTIHAKLALLRKFNALDSKCLNAIMLLEAKGEDVTVLETRKQKLEKEILQLRKAVHKAWQGQAASIQTRLSKISDDAQRAIRDIENDVNVAGKIVKLVGKLDDVVAEAKKLRGLVP